MLKTLIGNSTWLTLDEALTGDYIQRKDSAFYAEKIKNDTLRFTCRFFLENTKHSFIFDEGGKINADSLIKIYGGELKKAEAYSFQIKKMGWINCDKFYRYSCFFYG